MDLSHVLSSKMMRMGWEEQVIGKVDMSEFSLAAAPGELAANMKELIAGLPPKSASFSSRGSSNPFNLTGTNVVKIGAPGGLSSKSSRSFSYFPGSVGYSNTIMPKFLETFGTANSSFSVPDCTSISTSGSSSSFNAGKVPKLKSLFEGLTKICPEARAMLKEVGSWEFDIQRFAGLAKGRTLTSVTKKALRRLGLMKYFNRQQLDAFLQEMEALYKENDYHCNVHAADVVQAAFVMLSKGDLCKKFKEVELLALIIGAAGHDVGHPGLNNAHLVKINSPLALPPNNDSPNERNHAAITVSLIQKYGMLPKAESEVVCSLIPEIILKTDMKYHTALMQDFSNCIALHGKDISSWESVARTCALSSILHLADISNLAKPITMASYWGANVAKELQKQTALECALDNQAGPQQDCTQLKLAVSQLWFINTFALRDAFSLLDAVAPAFGQMVLAQLQENICFYEKIVEEAAAPSS